MAAPADGQVRLIPLRGKGAAVRRGGLLAETEGAGVAAVQREGGRVQED